MAKPTNRRDLKGKTLRKGEGQRRDGLYYFSWYDDLGKRHYIYDSNLDELRKKEDTVTLDLLSGISPNRSKLTLDDIIEI